MDTKEFFDKLPKRQEGKLNIYFHVSENSGVGYYRQYLPAKKLQDQGLANVLISDFRWGEGDHVEPSHAQLFAIANWADIIIVGRRDIADFYATWGGIREFFNIPIVLDSDDNVRNVRPTNPGYQGYFPGSDAIVWNQYASNKVFDAMTVSTQDLHDFHKKESPRIYVTPNNLDVTEWNNYPRTVWDDEYIHMAFIGSAAHGDGIRMIKKPVLDILKKYSNVKLHVTHVYNIYFTDFPEDIKKRIVYIPWIKLEDWAKSIKALGIDIGLAPLTDNLFNRAKSNLRWMEYSLAHIPAIVSPVKPYLCVRDGETGLYAKEPKDWFKAIEKLIKNEKLRKKIADNAFQEVCTKYNIDTNIALWDNIYKEIHSKFHSFWGPKKKYLPLGNGKWQEIK